LRRSIACSATAFTEPRMIPTPTSMYRMVKTLPAAVVGVRSPYPTLVSVTPLIYSESRKLHPSTCR
jgi:hypothetical protein